MEIEKETNNGVKFGTELLKSDHRVNNGNVEQLPKLKQSSVSSTGGSTHIRVDNYYEQMSDDVYKIYDARLEKVISESFKGFELKSPHVGGTVMAFVGLVSAVPTSDSTSLIFGFIPASEWRGFILSAMLLCIFFIVRDLWGIKNLSKSKNPKTVEEAILRIKNTFKERK